MRRMVDVNLYDHAERVQALLHRRTISLCVSRVPAGDRSERARDRLLLLHGNSASMDDFKSLAAQLRDDFELIAIVLPGFGRSANAPAVKSESVLETYARCVV